MDESMCEQVFQYSAGELGSLQRERMAAHVESCPQCREMAPFLEGMRWASAHAATPTTEAQKTAILAGLREELGTNSKSSMSWFGDLFTFPRLATVAVAAVLLMVGVWLLPRSAEIAAPTRMQSPPGAFIAGHEVKGWSVSENALENVVELTSGQLAADYDRQAAKRRLLVRTPKADVLITGTRFMVDASSAHTTVAVEVGEVVVTDASGSKTTVGAGEHLTVGHPPQPERDTLNELSEVMQTVPLQGVHRAAGEPEAAPKEATKDPTADTRTPAADSPTASRRALARKAARRQQAAARKNVSAPPTVEPAVPPPPPREPERELPSAEDLVAASIANGDCQVAGHLLLSIQMEDEGSELAQKIISAGNRLRRNLEYQKASACYNLLVTMPSSRQRNAALLENARLLAVHLNAPGRADALLRELSKGTGVVADQAFHERCQLRGQTSSEAARSCYHEYLERFENGVHKANVERILKAP